MKLTAHILMEVSVDDGVPPEDVARAVAACAERAAAGLRGDGFRAVDFSVATSPLGRAELREALVRAAGEVPR